MSMNHLWRDPIHGLVRCRNCGMRVPAYEIQLRRNDECVPPELAELLAKALLECASAIHVTGYGEHLEAEFADCRDPACKAARALARRAGVEE